ncbi:unnamed protein product, partial [Symbiodinium sp. CCMP2456]
MELFLAKWMVAKKAPHSLGNWDETLALALLRPGEGSIPAISKSKSKRECPEFGAEGMSARAMGGEVVGMQGVAAPNGTARLDGPKRALALRTH